MSELWRQAILLATTGFLEDLAAHSPTAMQRVFTSQDAAAVRRLSRHDSQLGKKVRSAMEIIDQAIERYGAALALSFNGAL